jgi:DNA-binding MarR family transcriptional regulator
MGRDREGQAEEILAGAQILLGISVRSLDSLENRVTMPQLRMLTVLHLGGAMNLSALADTVGISLSSASRLCDRLVSADLVHRRPSDRTRREVRLTLTAAGEDLLAAIDERRMAEIDRVLDSLPARRRGSIAAAFAEFARAATTVPEKQL